MIRSNPTDVIPDLFFCVEFLPSSAFSRSEIPREIMGFPRPKNPTNGNLEPAAAIPSARPRCLSTDAAAQRRPKPVVIAVPGRWSRSHQRSRRMQGLVLRAMVNARAAWFMLGMIANDG